MRNKKLMIIFSVICVLALLVVLNSVIFSVQHVDASCYNADDPQLEEQVCAHAGLKRGHSIFSVKEGKVIANVESSLGNVRVVNIERKFPNRVCINYIEIFPYLEVAAGDRFYICDNDARLVEVRDEATEPNKIIRLITNAQINSSAIGGALFDADSAAHRTTTEIMDALERLGFYRDTVEMIDFIDLRRSGFAYIRMHAGVTVKIIGTDGLQSKVRYAMSYYNAADELHRKSGTVVVTSGTNSYSTEDLYAQDMQNVQ